MKNLLFSLFLLALGAGPALAQSSRNGSYVPPVAPPKTYTTYSTSPGYTAPSNMYNSSRVYAPSYSPSKPASSGGGSVGASGGGPRTTSSSFYVEPSGRAYLFDFDNTRDDARDRVPTLPMRPEYNSKLMRPIYYDQQLRGLLQQGNYVAAVETYEAYLLAEPKSIQGWIHVQGVKAYYVTGSYQKGLDVVARYGSSLPDAYYPALCQMALGHYAAALPLLTAYGAEYPAPESRPADYDYHLARCLLYAPATATERPARNQQTLESLTRYLEAGGQRVPLDARALRAEALYFLGDYPHCVADATQELERNPRNASALYWRAEANSELKHYPAALLDFDQLLSYTEKPASIWNARAWTRCLAGNFAGALLDANEAWQRDSTGANAVNYLDTRGYARFGLGQYPAADEDYTRVVALNPASGLAYLMRGRTRLKLGQKALARADLQQAVKLGVSGHPTLKTADAQRLLAAPAGKAPTPARKAAGPAKARR